MERKSLLDACDAFDAMFEPLVAPIGIEEEPPVDVLCGTIDLSGDSAPAEATMGDGASGDVPTVAEGIQEIAPISAAQCDAAATLDKPMVDDVPAVGGAMELSLIHI